MKISPEVSFNKFINTCKQTNFAGNNYTEYLFARQQFLKNKHISQKYWTLKDFDMNRLEGIQNGLKTIGNLTMAQIKFILERSLEIVTQRGCNNMCAHCYADARPESYYRGNNVISKINFEDFKNLCEDFSTLKERIGFDIFNKKYDKYNLESDDYETLFHDADSATIYATDKNNKEYDYLDLAKMLNQASGKILVFDTSGWNIKDKKTQNRVENIVKKFMKDPEKYKFIQFNISFNPFHALYYNSILKEQEGKKEIANKLRNIYTTRTANVINTFLPIILNHNESLKFIVRSFPNSNLEVTKHFQENDLIDLAKETVSIFIDKYIKEMETKQDYAKTKDNIYILTQIFSHYLDLNASPTYVGRMTKSFNLTKSSKTIYTKPSDKNINQKMTAGIIDLNGKFYITNFLEIFPTNIQLNYSSKNKTTAPLNPNLNKHTINI